MNKKTFIQKSTGDTLEASEWNELTGYVNEAVDAINAGGSGDSVVSTEVDPLDADKTFVKIGSVTVAELTSKGEKGTNVGLSGDNNINIEPRPAAGDGSGKNTPGLANRKGGNIALKPGDDIEFWGHKRGSSKSDEVSVKIMTEVPKASDPTKTDEVAAKLQLNAGDIVLTSKDKQTQSDEMNITVNKAADTRGYLKVRAQAIDLRSESHGGIALQPKGTDGTFENKIKFEHGGGDGLEFGTFNTQHTSLYTNDYRFKKDGIIRLATRTTVPSDKADENDPTTAYKYAKEADDFYDHINVNDPTCTWEDVVRYISWAKNHNEGAFRNFFTGLDDGSGWSHSDSNSGDGIIISEPDPTLYVTSPTISLDAGTYKLSWETNDLTQEYGEPNCSVIVYNGSDINNPIYQSSEGGTGRMEVTFTINETIQNLSIEFTFTACDRIIQPKLELL